MNADIIIVGAGLVGCALALSVAQANSSARIVIVDAQASSVVNVSNDIFDPRVVALNPQSVGLLQQVGVWESIKALRVSPYQKMHVWDGEGTGSIVFDAAEVHQPQLGFIVENSVALSAMRDKLLAYSNVELLVPFKIISVALPGDASATSASTQLSTSVTLVNGQVISAPLLVGADGAQSMLRKHAKFTTREWSYEQSAIVTTVKTQKPNNSTAWQRFTDDGPLAFLPLQNTTESHTLGSPRGGASYYSSIVWSLNNDKAQEASEWSDEIFCAELGKSFEHKLGKVESTDARFLIPLKQMHVTEYFKPCVVLVGDAAHTIHPLAGQGVNVGLRDARVLAAEIHRALERKVPLSNVSILKRYQRKVQTHNLLVMSIMEGFKRAFVHNNPWVRVARNFGLRSANQFTGLKRTFMQLAAGESVRSATVGAGHGSRNNVPETNVPGTNVPGTNVSGFHASASHSVSVNAP